MIYRVHINDPEFPEGERWFARQLEGQFAKVTTEPLPREWQELIEKINAASERPSS
ncbi:hypothetical protein [Dongia sp.]|uniref:hypothetical protein n=1 Tax=Dongia sp. TaxID=1977262 RepID=UPI0035B46C74